MEGVKLGQAMIEGSPGWRFREFGTALRLRKQLKVIGKANNVMMMVYDEFLKTCLKAKIKVNFMILTGISLLMMRIMIYHYSDNDYLAGLRLI